MAKEQIEQTKEDQIDEFKASFDVPASTPEPVTPVGGWVKKRRGDKDQGEKSIIKQGSSDIADPLKSKSGMVKEVLAILTAQDKDTVETVLGRLSEGDFALAPKEDKFKVEDIDLSAEVAKVFEGQELSDEFKKKATIVFETAVITSVNKMYADLVEATEASLEEEVKTIKEELTEQIDGYLDSVVDMWVEDNTLAVDSGLRAELTEDFIGGLKNLFYEFYIEVPEDKTDIVEELAQRVKELEETANNLMNSNIELVDEVEAYRKDEIFAQVAEGLASTEIAKLRDYAENVEYTNDEEFAEKLSALRENYFSAKTVDESKKTEEVDTTVISESTENTLSDPMDIYAAHMKRIIPSVKK